jgi:hypothetical protein
MLTKKVAVLPSPKTRQKPSWSHQTTLRDQFPYSSWCNNVCKTALYTQITLATSLLGYQDKISPASTIWCKTHSTCSYIHQSLWSNSQCLLSLLPTRESVPEYKPRKIHSLHPKSHCFTFRYLKALS